MSQAKHVVVVGTGGTIASRYDPALGRAVASQGVEAILAAAAKPDGLPGLTFEKPVGAASTNTCIENPLSGVRVSCAGDRTLEETNMAERRRAARKKSFLRGCVYFNKRRGAVDCLIREISDEGARIIFSDAVNVPDLVELYVPQKEQTLRARVHWRHGDEIGLGFPDLARSAAAPELGELALRVAKLESTVATLRRKFQQLKSNFPGADETEAT